MNEEKEKLLKEIELCVTKIFADNNIGQIELNRCVNSIVSVIDRYDVISKCTEVSVIKNSNPKLVKLYIACLRLNGKSEKTIAQYFRTCKEFSFFINKSYLDISPYDIRLYLVMLGNRGYKNSSLENQRAYLSAFYKWLVKEEYLQKNPVDKVPTIKYLKKDRFPFTEVELDAMRQGCKNVKQRAILEMLLYTGVRASELCNLNVDDIDLENRIAYVINGKGGKNRRVYFNHIVAKYYKEYLNTRRDSDNAAFVSKLKKRLTTSGLRSILKTIESRSGVSNVHPHRFRRTLATNLSERGMSLNEIKVILGHANINTTMLYICVSDRRVNNSYDRYC